MSGQQMWMFPLEEMVTAIDKNQTHLFVGVYFLLLGTKVSIEIL